jgi:hypothetical protein
METRQGESVNAAQLETIAAAFRAGAISYRSFGSPLYAALCAGGAGDAEIAEVACHAQDGSQPVFHLLASVHYLLLCNPNDALGRFFPTLTDKPAPPDEAYPDFARYCRAHRGDILQLLAARTVQTTYVERCTTLMLPLSVVADEAGEPINLVEIGCSAGVLLTFDKYAYDLGGRVRIGSASAPLTLAAEVRGGPTFRIPRIGARIGLDLHPVDAKSDAERRWLMALSFPEFREQRARLATALDVVARTDIRMLKGDALNLLPDVLAQMPGPLCVFHSACLYYWSAAQKTALGSLLQQASRDRDIYRIGIEPSDQFNALHKGRAGAPESARHSGQPSGEVTIARYRNGAADMRIVARTGFSGPIEWIG